jgi:hypothetical protein
MDNRTANSAAVAAHREAFYRSVDELFQKFDACHTQIKTKSEYDDLVKFLSGPAKDKKVKKTPSEYYAIKNFVTMRGNETTYLISKKVYEDARNVDGDIDILKVKRLAAKEDLFEIIKSHHLLKHHAGTRNTWESVKKSYSNVSRDIVNKYVQLCSFKVNQRVPARAEGIRPILSKTFNDRGQMDLIACSPQYMMALHGSCIIRTI